jgi:hypothetical protein
MSLRESPRVDYYVHGRGRGHGSRVAAVVAGLRRAQASVCVHAGGQALDLIGEVLTRCRHEPRKPLLPGPLAPLRLLRRALDDHGALRRSASELVVSDGDQPVVLAARGASIPTLAVGHDLIFGHQVSLPGLPRGPLYYQRLNSLPMTVGDRLVAVHFLPATSQDPRLRIARPEGLLSPREATNEGHLVCYFRDGNGADIATYLVACGQRVLWFGGRGPVGRGVRCLPFSAPDFRRAVASAAGVVSSAGSNVLAECVALGKPILALFGPDDREQKLNAVLAQAAGVAVGCAIERAVPKGVRTFLSRLRTADFERVDLENALPPLSFVVFETACELVGPDAQPAPATASSSAYSLPAT